MRYRCEWDWGGGLTDKQQRGSIDRTKAEKYGALQTKSNASGARFVEKGEKNKMRLGEERIWSTESHNYQN
jgi:hypothetical protein